MAASLPTGLGFGAGYGAGVRIGYDVLYPKLQPFAQELVSGIVNAVRTVWSPGAPQDSPAAPGSSGSGGIDVTEPPKRVAPTGRTREMVDNCVVVKKRARGLQVNLQTIQVKLQKIDRAVSVNPRVGSSQRASLIRTRDKLSDELNALLNNPNNRSCVVGMKF